MSSVRMSSELQALLDGEQGQTTMIFLTDEVLERMRLLKSHREIVRRFPKNGYHLTDEQVELVVGGALSAADVAYCQQAVEYYHSKNYTLEMMQKEMTDHQNALKSSGQDALAKQSAEYLEYMTSIW